MKAVSIRILAAVVLILQGVAVVLAGLITVCQSSVKDIFAAGLEDTFSIPVASLVKLVVMAIFYGGFLFYLLTLLKEQKRSEVGAAVFIGIACLLQVLMNYVPSVETYLVASMGGTMAFANLSALNSAIDLITTPFTVVAFTLFCFTAGGSTGVRYELQQNMMGTYQ